jgi:hypothetical protein
MHLSFMMLGELVACSCSVLPDKSHLAQLPFSFVKKLDIESCMTVAASAVRF